MGSAAAGGGDGGESGGAGWGRWSLVATDANQSLICNLWQRSCTGLVSSQLSETFAKTSRYLPDVHRVLKLLQVFVLV